MILLLSLLTIIDQPFKNNYINYSTSLIFFILSIFGLFLIIISNDFLMLYIGLELSSIALLNLLLIDNKIHINYFYTLNNILFLFIINFFLSLLFLSGLLL